MKHRWFLLAFIPLLCLSPLPSSQACEIEKGDVNNDGSVNVIDAIKTVNFILGQRTPDDCEFLGADCSAPSGICHGDSVINVLDVLKIVNVVLGLDYCPDIDFIQLVDLEPDAGSPGTQIKVTTNLSVEAENFCVIINGIKYPVLSSGDSAFIFLTPLLEPGEVEFTVFAWNYYKSDTLTFGILSSEPTGLPPGEIITEIDEVTIEIADICQELVCTLSDSGYINPQDTTDFVETLDNIRQVLEQTQTLISQLPEDEKAMLDEYLYSSGLSDDFGITGNTGLRKEIGDYRAFWAQQGKYTTFYGAVCLDNISFALSAIKPMMRIASIGIALGTFGAGSGVSIALTMASFAVGAVDNVIEGFLPTDLHEIDVNFIPDQSGFFEIGCTATGDFKGYFESQSTPTEATVRIFLSSFLTSVEAGIVADLLIEIDEYYYLDLTTNILDLKPVTMSSPIPIDMDYYAITLIEIFDLVTPLDFSLGSICNSIRKFGRKFGLECPDLGIIPVVFYSSQVAYDLTTNTLTAVQAGELKKSDMVMTVWRMDRACEDEYGDKPWWGWACMGVELPKYIGTSEINFSPIKIYAPNEAPVADFDIDCDYCYEIGGVLQGNMNVAYHLDASITEDDRNDISDLEFQWDWDNDGIVDIEWNNDETETVYFDEIGEHPIKLEVRDPEGLIGTKIDIIETVNSAPIVHFNVTPRSGTVEDVFYFDASDTEDLEEPLSSLEFDWSCESDQGDCGTIDSETGITFSYQFSEPGTKRIVLWVTDSYGEDAYDDEYVTVGEISVPDPPALVSPSDASTISDNTPTFDWSGVSGAVAYELLVDNNSDFGSPEIQQNGLASSTYTPGSSLSDGTYNWKARGKDDLDNWGGWSDVWSFSISTEGPSPPSQSAPPNSSTTSDDTPTFDWSDVSGAVVYELLVDNNSNFSSPEIQQTNLTSSTYTTGSSLSDNTYYWKVRGKNSLGTWGEWSDIWDFIVSTGGDNTAPTASFSVDPTSGTTTTTFNVDASGSSDNEDPTSALQVRWDWEDDGTYDTGWSTTKANSHQYSTAGTKTIKLEVKDTGELTSNHSVSITVNNEVVLNFVDNHSTPDFASDVEVYGPKIYVTIHDSGFQTINISNPAASFLEGEYNDAYDYTGVAIVANNAFLSYSKRDSDKNCGGLRIVSVSDPTSPYLIGSIGGCSSFWHWARDVVVDGNYAYLADGYAGLHIFNISSPSSPSWVGRCYTPDDNYDDATRIVVKGSYAFLAAKKGGLQVIDITDPSSPFIAANYDVPSKSVYNVTLEGNLAYLSLGTSGIHILDITNPISPDLISTYSTYPSQAGQITIDGNYAFVAEYLSGILVLDISDPTTPYMAGGYDTAGRACEIAISGDYAYVADGDSGLLILSITYP